MYACMCACMYVCMCLNHLPIVFNKSIDDSLYTFETQLILVNHSYQRRPNHYTIIVVTKIIHMHP